LKEEELQSVGRVKDGCLDRRLPPKVSPPVFLMYVERDAYSSKSEAMVRETDEEGRRRNEKAAKLSPAER